MRKPSPARSVKMRKKTRAYGLKNTRTGRIVWTGFGRPHPDGYFKCWMEKWNDRACENKGLDISIQNHELVVVEIRELPTPKRKK